MNEIIIVIPSLEPDIKLINLIDSIREENSSMEILVVDDGSGKEYADIFRRIDEDSHSKVIHHSENFGKGVALKTAMKEIITNYPQARWMVTIDSDGQHSYQDMMKTVEMAKENPRALVMGTRQFDGEVPLRSRLGNMITRNILAIMTGIKLDDTQTGLRVIPVSFLPKLIVVKGDRFEYETNMLIEAKKQSWPILSQTIATTYIEENESSHFRVVADSLSIYGTLFKYLLSSISSFIVDIVVYTVLIYLLSHLSLSDIVLASLIARFVSSLFNYFMNREFVFVESSNNSFIKYYALVVVQILLSAFLVFAVHQITGWSDTVIVKVVVDSLLFILSYQIQKHFIFKKVEEVNDAKDIY